MPVTFTVPVTLVTRTKTGVDDFGNDVYTETSTATEGVFAPGGSTERTAGGDTVTTIPTVFLPAELDVTAVDEIQVGGLSYEVDGDPADWSLQPNPFNGWIPDFPVVVTLQRVTG